MKICPKCNSTYTDESLNFCLTDGVLLLKTDTDLQDAVTIFDADLQDFQPTVNNTSPNSASATDSQIKLKTDTFSDKQPISHSYLRPLLGVLAMVSAIGIIFWWLYTNGDANSANKQVAVDSQIANKPRIVVPLTPEQENLTKKEVTDLVEEWRKSIEKRDADANVKFYTQTLDTYYRESGIDRNHVRADRQRAIDRYETLTIQIDKLQIKPETPEMASAIFDKSWTFKNPVKVSTGSVQQEMYFVKQKGKWFINGEKDVKVYYINNRENADANTQNANQ